MYLNFQGKIYKLKHYYIFIINKFISSLGWNLLRYFIYQVNGHRTTYKTIFIQNNYRLQFNEYILHDNRLHFQKLIELIIVFDIKIRIIFK